MRSDLPSGTVTFLLSDIEGSTKLLHELGADGYTKILLEHRRALREAFARHGGIEVGTEGDSFFVAFPTAPGALAAAAEGQELLAQGPIRVRMGLHTGTAHLAEGDYVGEDVHKAARIAAAGHGGQVLVSGRTRELAQVELTDLGEHRLKDFAEPVRIFQLGSERFPPLKTIANTNLPRPASSFVGREREVAEVVFLLKDIARLLTLTGPGGSGKTRLAIEAASELVPEFKAGVFWVGLAPVRDPALVTETIAQTLGAKDGLAGHIGERELLLLLDNLEQVMEAAPELSALVEACPNLKVLVTSRELMRVRGEVEYPVFPLAEPEAVDLFCRRAGAQADEVVHRLCRALDNLPLALELAAARARVLSPQQILERLAERLDLLKGGRDTDPRQQTLRATIEWSYELLAAEEQRLFARLSVFAGGCTLESAEQVAEADLDTFQSLNDKSILRRTGERFWMLETIREYAVGRLEKSGEAEQLRQRHAEFCLTLAERAFEERFASEERLFPILEAEHNNIRAALNWAQDHDVRTEAQLAGAVAPFWMLRGHAREARDRLSGALARYEKRDAIRARALTYRGELDDSIPVLEDALTIWREIGDAKGEALGLETIGWVHDVHGNYPAAQEAHERSLAVRREAGAPEVEGASSRAGLCHVYVASGEIERAEAMAHQLLAVAVRSNASHMHQLALHFLADCPLVAGNYPEAERRYLRALAFARKAGLPGRCTDEVLGVAMSIAGQGNSSRAVRLAAAAHIEQERIGQGTDHWWGTMQDLLLGAARGRLSTEDLREAEREGTGIPFEAVLDEVLGVDTTPDN